jgi:tRNA threonylcarbamoyladenosine biosynthesis protein TsaE
VRTTWSASPAQTRAIGAGIAGVLRAGDVVLLVGSLGAGKTTLVQGLVRALGAQEAVTSPTFTLAHRYKTAPPLTHVDLWRLEHLQEVVELALDEELEEGGVVIVEWGEAAEPLYGADALVVRLGWGLAEGERTVEIEFRGEAWSSREVELAEAFGATAGGAAASSVAGDGAAAGGGTERGAAASDVAGGGAAAGGGTAGQG